MPITLCKKILLFISTVFLTALAYYFSTGFNNIWILAWLAPIPICILALEISWSATFLAGFLAYFCGTLSYLPYIQFLYFPFRLTISANLIDSLAFAIVLLLFRYFAVKGKKQTASLMFAFAWTGFEFIRSLLTIEGTFQSLAYTQTTVLPIIQIASLIGIWGITFLLMLIPSSIALAYSSRKIKTLVIPCCLLICTLLFGAYRLYFAAQDQGPTLKIGLAAVSITPEQLFINDLETKLMIVAKYKNAIAKLAKQGAKVVLLPEEIVMVNPEEKESFLRLLSTSAQESHVFLIVGIKSLLQHTDELHIDEENTIFSNIAYLFSPEGKILIQYYKHHPWLTFERKMIRGSSLGVIDIKELGKWGIETCIDVDFVNPSLQYSKWGINILLSPAINVDTDGWLHGRIAIMQGVAGNFAVARTAQQGMLSFSDSRGRILASAITNSHGNDTLLIREMKTGGGNSLYSRLGDWFAWLCVGMSVLVLLLSCIRRK